MRKIGPIFIVFLLLLTGCGQEKVMNTEFIRLQNKVKDLENAQKQHEEDLIRANQKLADLEKIQQQQAETLSGLVNEAQKVQQEEIHPVIIQDVKITSKNMDASGRLWGPFDLNITLYNGTENTVSDYISTIILTDHPTKAGESPQVKQMVQKFDLKAKESKIVTFSQIPVNDPAKRLNIVVKLLEQAPLANHSGVPGKATWVLVPTIIFPANGSDS